MVEKKSQFNQYKYIVAVMSGSILITIVLIFIIGKPLFISIQGTSKDVKDKELKIEMLEEKIVNLKNLEYKKEELEDQNKTVLAALPKDKEVARLFVQFESIFNESSASISSVSESNDISQETTPGIIIPVAYQVTGRVKDYLSLKQALTKLEGALRILSVSSIDITGEESDLSIAFIINTFTRGQE